MLDVTDASDTLLRRWVDNPVPGDVMDCLAMLKLVAQERNCGS